MTLPPSFLQPNLVVEAGRRIGVAQLRITKIGFPAPSIQMHLLAKFAQDLLAAVQSFSGQAKLRAYEPVIDCPACIEIEVAIESSRDYDSLIARGQVHPGFSRTKPTPGHLELTLPRHITVHIAASLAAWCQEPSSKLSLPLRVDA